MVQQTRMWPRNAGGAALAANGASVGNFQQISRLNLPNYKGALMIGDALHFIYTTSNPIVTAASGAAGAVSSDALQVQADSAFLIEQIAFMTFQDALFVAQNMPPLLLQLTDSGSGASIFSAPIPIGNVGYGGAGLGPFPLVTPRLIAPASLVTVTITNLDTAHAYTTRINFQGRKIYSMAPIS